MTKEKSDEAEIKFEEAKPKTFVLSCETMDAMEDVMPEIAKIGPQEFFDKIDAANEEEAKDIVTGFLAERDFIVKRWNFCMETSYLNELARAVNP